MKIRKFIFKFVDHDNKKVTKVVVEIQSDKMNQWKENESDIDGYVNWMSQHARWEKNLELKVKNMVHLKYFFNQTKQFGDYRIMKECCRTESKCINLDVKKSDEINFLLTKCMETHKFKYVRGSLTGDWLEMFKCAHVYDHYHFKLVDEDSKDIVLKLLNQEDGRIVVTEAKVEQKGGGHTSNNDYQKYKKYKKKYIALKDKY